MSIFDTLFNRKTPKQYCTTCGQLQKAHAYPQTYRYDNGKPEPLEYWFECEKCRGDKPEPPRYMAAQVRE